MAVTAGNQRCPCADLLGVRCIQAREAVSARLDDESPGEVEEELSAHLSSCVGCAAFASRVAALAEVIGPGTVRPYAELEELATGFPLRAPRRSVLLRLVLALLALVELLTPLVDLFHDHGYGGEDHAGHETLSFTVAVAAGLLMVAVRPLYARGYLPLVVVAAVLLLATAFDDVVSGRAGLVDELPHLNLVLAGIVLWLLAHSSGGRRRHRHLAVRRQRQPRRTLRAVVRIAVAVAASAPVVVAVPAFAHATLGGSTPAAGSVVPTLPDQVVLSFDEAVTTTPTSLRVFGPQGERVDAGAAQHPGGVGSRVAVGVRGAGEGTYLVAWRVVSADTHPASGSFTFSVGHPSRAPAVATAPSDHLVSVLLGVTRWIGYAGVALLIGAVVFLELCWRVGWEMRPLRALPWLGLGAVLLAAVLGFLLKGPYDAGLGLGSTGQSALLAEVAHSSYGHAALGRVVCLAVIAALLGCRRVLPRMLVVGSLAISFVALALTFALSGHAVAEHQAWLGLLVDTVHVVAMSIWVGGLVAMVIALRRGGAVSEPDVSRFSALALGSVVVLVLTGTYQSWRHVGAWAALVDTTYGRELLVKIGLVAVVLVVAAVSRQLARSGGGAATALRRTVTVELVGAVVILAVTSALVATQPADETYHPSVSATLRFGQQSVRVSAVPDGERRMRLHLDVLGPQGQPVEPKQVTASAALPGQDVDGLPVDLARAGRGHRVAELVVPLAGDWQLTVTVRTSPIDESSQVLTVPIR